MKKTNKQVNKKLKEVGKGLGLRRHVCGRIEGGTERVWLGGDVEGHMGVDGNLYVLDFSRLLPPVWPDLRYVISFLFSLYL